MLPRPDQWFVILLVLSVSIPTVSASDQVLRARFIEEIQKAKNASTFPSLRIIINSQQKMSANTARSFYTPEQFDRLKRRSGDPLNQQRSSEYAFHKQALLKKETVDGRISITGKNDRYTFGISRADQASQYVLNFLEKTGSPVRRDAIAAEEQRARLLLAKPWIIQGQHLADWLTKENFVLKQVSRVEQEGETLIRADFEHIVTEISPGNISFHQAHVLCDPERGWAVKEFSATIKNAQGEDVSQCTTSNTLELVDPGIPVVVSCENTTELLSARGNVVSSHVQFQSQDDVSPEEFYLTHYGLPEPNFQTSWMTAWMKYLLAGIVCLGIAYGVRRYRVSVV